MEKVAWILLDPSGRILCTRNRGRQLYYLPGGKREPGESDVETLAREVGEELGVTIDTATCELVGVFEAQADAQPPGVMVRMACYSAAYHGTLAPAHEVEEMVWLTHADIDRVSPVDRLVFARLHRAGRLT
jgi:8-oxo-dGTP diphosphatase